MELGIIIAIVLVLGFGVFLYKKGKEDKKQRMDSGLVTLKRGDDGQLQVNSTVGTREGVVGPNPNLHPEYRKDKN